MKKLFYSLKIFLPLILLQYGCSVKNDIREDTEVYSQLNAAARKQSLEDLEELYDNMDYQHLIDKYSGAVPGLNSITRFRYFVIFSTLNENTTYNLIDKDIRITVDAMTNNYLSDLPDSVTPVFFFKDYNTYRDLSVNMFGIEENDLSPYGFYKISVNAVLIRYVSWKGSTPHEITHTLIQNDFPDIPSWFNEGLSSLHEKYIYKDGDMIGDFSWRIVALRKAFDEDTYTKLRKLMETNDEELYNHRTSFYYAQATYLLLYLQQKGLLKTYYKLFRETRQDDPTGIAQLEKITQKPLKKIDKELVDYINSFD